MNENYQIVAKSLEIHVKMLFKTTLGSKTQYVTGVNQFYGLKNYGGSYRSQYDLNNIYEVKLW